MTQRETTPLRRLLHQLEVVAGEHLTGGVAKVHGAALAVAPGFAVAALVCLHPAAVAVGLEAVLPDIPEIILVDVALVVVAAYAQAAGYGAVAKDGCYAYARYAVEQMVTYQALVAAHKALT